MHTKRMAAGGQKGIKWTATPRGPHRKTQATPLVSILRDLGHADNAREARSIIVRGLVHVDGIVRKDMNYGVGLMDVVSIPLIKKSYRVVPEKNGLVLREIKEKDAKHKLCRVIGKKTLPQGKIQIALDDGTSIIGDSGASVNDTVLLELPDKKIKEVLKLVKGQNAIVVSGRHRGSTGAISEVAPGTEARKSLTTIGDFQTLTEYVLASGKEKFQVE